MARLDKPRYGSPRRGAGQRTNHSARVSAQGLSELQKRLSGAEDFFARKRLESQQEQGKKDALSDPQKALENKNNDTYGRATRATASKLTLGIEKGKTLDEFGRIAIETRDTDDILTVKKRYDDVIAATLSAMVDSGLEPDHISNYQQFSLGQRNSAIIRHNGRLARIAKAAQEKNQAAAFKGYAADIGRSGANFDAVLNARAEQITGDGTGIKKAKQLLLAYHDELARDIEIKVRDRLAIGGDIPEGELHILEASQSAKPYFDALVAWSEIVDDPQANGDNVDARLASAGVPDEYRGELAQAFKVKRARIAENPQRAWGNKIGLPAPNLQSADQVFSAGALEFYSAVHTDSSRAGFNYDMLSNDYVRAMGAHFAKAKEPEAVLQAVAHIRMIRTHYPDQYARVQTQANKMKDSAMLFNLAQHDSGNTVFGRDLIEARGAEGLDKLSEKERDEVRYWVMDNLAPSMEESSLPYLEGLIANVIKVKALRQTGGDEVRNDRIIEEALSFGKADANGNAYGGIAYAGGGDAKVIVPSNMTVRQFRGFIADFRALDANIYLEVPESVGRGMGLSASDAGLLIAGKIDGKTQAFRGDIMAELLRGAELRFISDGRYKLYNAQGQAYKMGVIGEGGATYDWVLNVRNYAGSR